MRAPVWLAVLVSFVSLGWSENNASNFNTVDSNVFDPKDTDLVASRWITEIGCPTGEKTYDGSKTTPYTDTACPTGDKNDKDNTGLLLVKGGPTTNYAAAGADLRTVRGLKLTELGYDIRYGSHCGAGAPRFNIVTDDNATHFIGCNSPAPKTTLGDGWQRRRWVAGAGGLMAYNAKTGVLEPVNRPVKSISIIFDEGQDTTSDAVVPESFSGLAVLDNIDVNGKLVGKR